MQRFMRSTVENAGIQASALPNARTLLVAMNAVLKNYIFCLFVFVFVVVVRCLLTIHIVTDIGTLVVVSGSTVT